MEEFYNLRQLARKAATLSLYSLGCLLKWFTWPVSCSLHSYTLLPRLLVSAATEDTNLQGTRGSRSE